MKSRKLEKIDRSRFISLDPDEESLFIGGQSSNQITHPGTLTPAGHDIGTDMISDV